VELEHLLRVLRQVIHDERSLGAFLDELDDVVSNVDVTRGAYGGIEIGKSVDDFSEPLLIGRSAFATGRRGGFFGLRIVGIVPKETPYLECMKGACVG